VAGQNETTCHVSADKLIARLLFQERVNLIFDLKLVLSLALRYSLTTFWFADFYIVSSL